MSEQLEARIAEAIKVKCPLKGMPFDLDDLKKTTKRAFAQNPSKGWADARRRGYRWLMRMHFPS